MEVLANEQEDGEIDEERDDIQTEREGECRRAEQARIEQRIDEVSLAAHEQRAAGQSDRDGDRLRPAGAALGQLLEP